MFVNDPLALMQVLLSIFKGRTFEKSIEKVDLEIYDGPRAGETHNREIDELESRLVIRLHCNKGSLLHSNTIYMLI